MGTFIISFIGNSFVESMTNNQLLSRFMSPPSRRRTMVIIFFSIILSMVTLCECYMLHPRQPICTGFVFSGNRAVYVWFRFCCMVEPGRKVWSLWCTASTDLLTRLHTKYGISGQDLTHACCASVLSLLTVGVLTIPDIASEGVDFVNRLQSDNIWVVLVEKMRAGLG